MNTKLVRYWLDGNYAPNTRVFFVFVTDRECHFEEMPWPAILTALSSEINQFQVYAIYWNNFEEDGRRGWLPDDHLEWQSLKIASHLDFLRLPQNSFLIH